MDKDTRVFICRETTNNMVLTSLVYNIIRRAMVPLNDIQFYATPHPDYGYIALELDNSNSNVDRVGIVFIITDL